MSKKLTSLEQEKESLQRLIDHVESQISRELDERTHEIHRRIGESIHKAETDFQQSMKQRDDLHSYIDRRFDKTIDTLCTRMDIMFVKKEDKEQILKS